jgi:hypothetical protein
MPSTKRLLLDALLNGLGKAIRRNDGLAANRYQRRIGLIADHFDTNPRLSQALERLRLASGRWLAVHMNVADHYEAEEQVLELIEGVTQFL